VGLDEGMRKTVEWYNVKGQRFSPVEFAAVEIKEKMPPSWARPDLLQASYVTGSRVKADAMTLNEVGSGASYGFTEMWQELDNQYGLPGRVGLMLSCTLVLLLVWKYGGAIKRRSI